MVKIALKTHEKHTKQMLEPNYRDGGNAGNLIAVMGEPSNRDGNLITVMGYLITVMGHFMANPITVMENLIGVMADEEASGQPQRAAFGPRVPRLGHPCRRRGPRGQKDFESVRGPDLRADGMMWAAGKPWRRNLFCCIGSRSTVKAKHIDIFFVFF